MKEKIVYNGKYFDKGAAIIGSESRGLRFGDGCFETMKVVNGEIALKELHFERLFSSLEILQFSIPKNFTADLLKDEILSLAKKNGAQKLVRVRLTIFRSEGGLFDPENDFPNYMIETYSLEPLIADLNENGLALAVFKDARKSIDRFSSIKTNNFLSYAMAAKWAKQQKLNDAIILNSSERIADTTIANLFIVSDGIIKTPALTEGCIAGVMRRYLIECCRNEGIPVKECEISLDELKNANEVFTTNAIRGIKWVRQVGENGYGLSVASMLQKKFIKPLNC